MKNLEELIRRKIRGFKFESNENACYVSGMDSYMGKIGIIEKIYGDGTCKIDFGDDYFYYPADQIEAHLVEENEIPTLTDGVMMLVSDDEKVWEERKAYFKYNQKIYVLDFNNGELISYKYYKPLEPTKEEQLTAILGSSDKVAEIMELFKNE